MRRLLLIPATALFLSSCGFFSHPVNIPGRNAANNAAGMSAAQQYLAPAEPEVSDICDVDSLNSTMVKYERKLEVIKGKEVKKRSSREFPVGANSTVTKEYAPTIGTDCCSEFELELDAAYQATMTSCRSYARCMQNNFYDEGQCRSNLASWERARDDFADLARELREIEAEVDRDAINRRGYYRGAYINRHERCDCSDSVGGVFANCCDKDSDYRRGKDY